MLRKCGWDSRLPSINRGRSTQSRAQHRSKASLTHVLWTQVTIGPGKSCVGPAGPTLGQSALQQPAAVCADVPIHGALTEGRIGAEEGGGGVGGLEGGGGGLILLLDNCSLKGLGTGKFFWPILLVGCGWTMGNMTQSTLQTPQTLDSLAKLCTQEASALRDATTRQLFTLKLHLKLST